jgi:hypothetical protein
MYNILSLQHVLEIIPSRDENGMDIIYPMYPNPDTHVGYLLCK